MTRAIGQLVPSSNRTVERTVEALLGGYPDWGACYARIPFHPDGSGQPAHGYDLPPIRAAVALLRDAGVAAISWNGTKGCSDGFQWTATSAPPWAPSPAARWSRWRSTPSPSSAGWGRGGSGWWRRAACRRPAERPQFGARASRSRRCGPSGWRAIPDTAAAAAGAHRRVRGAGGGAGGGCGAALEHQPAGAAGVAALEAELGIPVVDQRGGRRLGVPRGAGPAGRAGGGAGRADLHAGALTGPPALPRRRGGSGPGRRGRRASIHRITGAMGRRFARCGQAERAPARYGVANQSHSHNFRRLAARWSRHGLAFMRMTDAIASHSHLGENHADADIAAIDIARRLRCQPCRRHAGRQRPGAGGGDHRRIGRGHHPAADQRRWDGAGQPDQPAARRHRPRPHAGHHPGAAAERRRGAARGAAAAERDHADAGAAQRARHHLHRRRGRRRRARRPAAHPRLQRAERHLCRRAARLRRLCARHLHL